jgi:RHS repeat-associated protein
MIKGGILVIVFLLIAIPITYSKVFDVPEVKKGEGELIIDTPPPEPLIQEVGIKENFYSGSSLVFSDSVQGGRYYHQDRMGSNRITTDTSGNLEERYMSLPFGQAIYNEVDHGFTGKEEDESGLHNFGARYYDSNLGKFVSVDPVKENHPYSYVANNPLGFVDPNGMEFGITGGISGNGWNFAEDDIQFGIFDSTYGTSSWGTDWGLYMKDYIPLFTDSAWKLPWTISLNLGSTWRKENYFTNLGDIAKSLSLGADLGFKLGVEQEYYDLDGVSSLSIIGGIGGDSRHTGNELVVGSRNWKLGIRGGMIIKELLFDNSDFSFYTQVMKTHGEQIAYLVDQSDPLALIFDNNNVRAITDKEPNNVISWTSGATLDKGWGSIPGTDRYFKNSLSIGVDRITQNIQGVQDQVSLWGMTGGYTRRGIMGGTVSTEAGYTHNFESGEGGPSGSLRWSHAF